jgi:hypothetical protein
MDRQDAPNAESRVGAAAGCLGVASTERPVLMRRAPCEHVLLIFGIVCPEPNQTAEALHDRRDESIVGERALDFLA